MNWRISIAMLGMATLSLTGCSNTTTPTVPNPFTTADRVPPPPTRAITPGTAQPYYPATPQAAPPAAAYPGANPYPGATAAPAYPGTAYPAQTAPGQPLPGQPYPGQPLPGQPLPAQPAAPTYPGSGTRPAPLGATPRRSPEQFASSGQSISVPSDQGSLRFASPSQVNTARVEAIASAATNNPQLANPQLASRPATANSWIAGSAPVRRTDTSLAAAPRVRVPGQDLSRQPVSLAAIDPTAPREGSVGIQPLEPAPLSNGQPGEPAPLRVATPSATGWR